MRQDKKIRDVNRHRCKPGIIPKKQGQILRKGSIKIIGPGIT